MEILVLFHFELTQAFQRGREVKVGNLCEWLLMSRAQNQGWIH